MVFSSASYGIATSLFLCLPTATRRRVTVSKYRSGDDFTIASMRARSKPRKEALYCRYSVQMIFIELLDHWMEGLMGKACVQQSISPLIHYSNVSLTSLSPRSPSPVPAIRWRVFPHPSKPRGSCPAIRCRVFWPVRDSRRSRLFYR